MKLKTTIFTILLMLVMVACKNTSTTVISSTTGITSFYLISKFSTTVKNYTFTIDTINHVIYNEDSLDFGSRLDSLAPVMYPVFTSAVLSDSINLYASDTVYVNLSSPRKLKVVSSTGDTATYTVTVNVHKVDPDSFIWKRTFDLGTGVITRQKAVMNSNGMMFWLMQKDAALQMYSSADGESWRDVSVRGLPFTVDIEHIVSGSALYAMKGNDLYSFDGAKWSKTITTSGVAVRHLLMVFKGDLYALGVGNVILKLVGSCWQKVAEMGSGFPVTGESAFVGQSAMGRDVAYIAFGIDDQGNYLQNVWSSEDGSYWVNLTEKKNKLSPRAFAMVQQYDEGLLVIGGMTGDGISDSLASDNFMFSRDYGMTWEKCDTLCNLDSNLVKIYTKRISASMMVNKKARAFLVGGRNLSGKSFGDVWRGLHYSSIPGFEE